MNLIFFRYDGKEDAYYPQQAGKDIVPTSTVDKVLPVSENVMRQFEKVYFKNGKLKVRDGMTLLNDSELDKQDTDSISDVPVPFNDSNSDIVKVEL